MLDVGLCRRAGRCHHAAAGGRSVRAGREHMLGDLGVELVEGCVELRVEATRALLLGHVAQALLLDVQGAEPEEVQEAPEGEVAGARDEECAVQAPRDEGHAGARAPELVAVARARHRLAHVVVVHRVHHDVVEEARRRQRQLAREDDLAHDAVGVEPEVVERELRLALVEAVHEEGVRVAHAHEEIRGGAGRVRQTALARDGGPRAVEQSEVEACHEARRGLELGDALARDVPRRLLRALVGERVDPGAVELEQRGEEEATLAHQVRGAAVGAHDALRGDVEDDGDPCVRGDAELRAVIAHLREDHERRVRDEEEGHLVGHGLRGEPRREVARGDGDAQHLYHNLAAEADEVEEPHRVVDEHHVPGRPRAHLERALEAPGRALRVPVALPVGDAVGAVVRERDRFHAPNGGARREGRRRAAPQAVASALVEHQFVPCALAHDGAERAEQLVSHGHGEGERRRVRAGSEDEDARDEPREDERCRERRHGEGQEGLEHLTRRHCVEAVLPLPYVIGEGHGEILPPALVEVPPRDGVGFGARADVGRFQGSSGDVRGCLRRLCLRLCDSLGLRGHAGGQPSVVRALDPMLTLVIGCHGVFRGRS
mmetsp:Transcript_10368/g.30767  ORF Transcript_10368/g.30767 Transcript_10368/m.30767 type:complete len:602 (-) Transcript_10368:472-2277(-)